MSNKSGNRFVATCREAVKIGSEDWRMESVSKVFHINQPLSDVLEWAERMGVTGASVNSIVFSELDDKGY